MGREREGGKNLFQLKNRYRLKVKMALIQLGKGAIYTDELTIEMSNKKKGENTIRTVIDLLLRKAG